MVLRYGQKHEREAGLQPQCVVAYGSCANAKMMFVSGEAEISTVKQLIFPFLCLWVCIKYVACVAT